MGAKMSTVQDRRAPILANIKPAPTVLTPKYTNKPSQALAPAGLGAPSMFKPNRVAASANRPKAFHSSASWKAYFEASKLSSHLVVIDFTAAWCGPCRSMEPTFNELAAKYTDVEFVKIDVDELFDVSRQMGVQAMPTFLFLKKGNVIDKVVGAKKEDLQKKIEKHRA